MWCALGRSGVSAWRSAQGPPGLGQNLLAKQGYLMLGVSGNRVGVSELRTAESPLHLCRLLKSNLGTHQQFLPSCISSPMVEICMFLWCSVMQIRDPQSGSDWPCMNPWCRATPWRSPQTGSEQNGISLQPSGVFCRDISSAPGRNAGRTRNDVAGEVMKSIVHCQTTRCPGHW